MSTVRPFRFGQLSDETAACKPDVKMEQKAETDVDLTKVNTPIDESVLKCGICLEIMHIPVSAARCSHNFCAACLYRWLDEHPTCPKCRVIVKDVSKDVVVTHICENYGKCYPERVRTKEALIEQDKAELEYIDKLLHRSQTSTDYSPVTIADDERFLDILTVSRKLPFYGNKKVRENEWIQRATNLREQLSLPVKDYSVIPPAPNNDDDDLEPLQHLFHLDGYRLLELDRMDDDENARAISLAVQLRNNVQQMVAESRQRSRIFITRATIGRGRPRTQNRTAVSRISAPRMRIGASAASRMRAAPSPPPIRRIRPAPARRLGNPVHRGITRTPPAAAPRRGRAPRIGGTAATRAQQRNTAAVASTVERNSNTRYNLRSRPQ